jgi:hypothetical protein
LDIGVLGYIGILYHKEHPPEVWHIPPGTPCISNISNHIPWRSHIFESDTWLCAQYYLISVSFHHWVALLIFTQHTVSLTLYKWTRGHADIPCVYFTHHCYSRRVSVHHFNSSLILTQSKNNICSFVYSALNEPIIIWILNGNISWANANSEGSNNNILEKKIKVKLLL